MTDPYFQQRKHTRREHQQPDLLDDKSAATTSSLRPRRTVSSLVLPAADDFLKEQCWRRFGKARRSELLERDHLEFRINPSCTIEKYFSLAEQVFTQFRSMCDSQETSIKDAEDAYVLGHRLVTFLSTALPRHPGYHTSLDQRMRCVTETVYVRTQLKRLALKIDEEQLNRFMENEYEPPETDDDDEDDEESASWHNETTAETENPPLLHHQQQQQRNWESFQGWSNCSPSMVETDESSYDEHDESTLVNCLQQEHAKHDEECYQYADPELDNVSLGSSSTSSSDSDSDDPTSVMRPSASPALFDVDDPELDDIVDPDEDVDDDPSSTRYEFKMVSSFLEKIAQEDVFYETDSDAADSWAQSDPVPESNSDEARKTLGEILNRHAELVIAMDQEISDACRRAAPSPPPPPPPSNSPDEGTGSVKQLGFLNCVLTQRFVSLKKA